MRILRAGRVGSPRRFLPKFHPRFRGQPDRSRRTLACLRGFVHVEILHTPAHHRGPRGVDRGDDGRRGLRCSAELASAKQKATGILTNSLPALYYSDQILVRLVDNFAHTEPAIVGEDQSADRESVRRLVADRAEIETRSSARRLPSLVKVGISRTSPRSRTSSHPISMARTSFSKSAPTLRALTRSSRITSGRFLTRPER